MRNRLVLPVPFGPAMRSSVPFSAENDSPEKSSRSPRSQVRSTASIIERTGALRCCGAESTGRRPALQVAVTGDWS